MTDMDPGADGPEPATADHVARARAMWSSPRRLRLFFSGGQRPRTRRSTDVLLVVCAAVGTVLLVNVADPPGAFEMAVADLVSSMPGTLEILWMLFAGLQLGWATLLVLLTAIRWRPAILRDLLLAALGGGALAVAIDEQWFGGTTGGLWHALFSVEPPPQPTAVRLAVVVAVTVVASPHLTRPFRRLSRWLVALGSVSLVILGATTPTGAVIGVLCGTMSAAVVHLLFGTAAGMPSMRDIADALVDLGIDSGELHESGLQSAGVFAAETTDAEGSALLVRVYGRDAWGAQLLATGWRSVWYREAEAPTLTRLQQAEHEAFVTLLAEREGVPVDRVVSAGVDAGDDALIVLRRPPLPLVGDADRPVDPELLGAVWDTVGSLHDAGIAHRDLAPDRFRIDGTRAVLGGFASAVVAPTGDQLRCDEAQLLVTSVLLGGLDETLRLAEGHLGADGIATLVPYLQIPALGRSLRQEVHRLGLDLDEVRTAAAAAAGIEEPAPARLRRVSRSALIQAVALSVGAYFLLSSLSGIDFAQVWEEIQDAAWALLVVALLLGQTPRFAQAESAQGACPRKVAYGPLVLLQFAITFINLVLPSTAARVATNVRFFQRQGIPAASAMSIGVIDSLGGFVVQLVILAGALLFGEVELSMPADSTLGEGNLLTFVVAVAALAIVATLVALVVPKVRHKARDLVAPRVVEVRETVGSLRSPAKVAQVLGGNIGAELLFAGTLALVLGALDTSVPLGTLLVINVCVSLFAGVMPVPGGIGVTEGALIFGLTAAGVDEATAFAATICYRLITFYLPPVWGAGVFRHMEHDGLL